MMFSKLKLLSLGIIIIFAALLFCFEKQKGQEGISFEAIFPETLETRWLIRFDELRENTEAVRMNLVLDTVGVPYFQAHHRLIALPIKDKDQAVAFQVEGLAEAESLAWLNDGILLAIKDKMLYQLRESEFIPWLKLPDDQMRIETSLLLPYSHKKCYLFGGSSSEQQRNLYLLSDKNCLIHLFEANEEITAVDGNAMKTWVALGSKLCLFEPGEDFELLLEADSEITSIALGPSGMIFYATATTVNYRSASGYSMQFIKGNNIKIECYGSNLYLFVPGMGILYCSLTSEFAEMEKELRGE